MIISASRRTDIPAFYSKWFMRRIKDGFVYVRNPMNTHQVSCIPLSPDAVDCIVFWTKNPAPSFIDALPALDDMGYKYYFQYSITSYNDKIERHIGKKEVQIEKFVRLSDAIGRDKVIWRYDPIFVSEYYDMDYHAKWFEYIASRLAGKTGKCIISFLDRYKKIEKRLDEAGIKEPTAMQMLEAGERLAKIAARYSIKIETCCETADLSQFGIEHGHCIDADLISRICGKRFALGKDKSQRQNCGCVESVDIGAYNTCRNGCVYCYATWKENAAPPCGIDSPILGAPITEKDKITERAAKSCEVAQEVFPSL